VFALAYTLHSLDLRLIAPVQHSKKSNKLRIQ